MYIECRDYSCPEPLSLKSPLASTKNITIVQYNVEAIPVQSLKDKRLDPEPRHGWELQPRGGQAGDTKTRVLVGNS